MYFLKIVQIFLNLLQSYVKPIINWNYHKLKIHLIHLTYRTPLFSLAYFKQAQNTYIHPQLRKII